MGERENPHEHMPPKRQHLEVDEDLEFQKRDWTFERIGWGFLLVVLVAAMTGALGRGPLSQRRVEAPDGSVRVEYGRMERHGAPAALTVTARRRAPTDTSIWIWMNEDFLDGVAVDRLIPEPLTERSDARHTLLEFALPRGTDSTRVTIRFTPDRIGPRVLELGILGTDGMRLGQFVYP